MKTYTITSEQISSIHNAMCDIRVLRENFNEMFKDDSHIVKKLERAFKYLEPVRKDLMDRKDADFDRIYKLSEEYAKDNNITETRWSIYDIDSFEDDSGIPPGAKIVAPWETKKSIIVEGTDVIVTWLTLWKAVDDLAKMVKDEDGEVKGFGNHVFIEKFIKVAKEDNTYEVCLGS